MGPDFHYEGYDPRLPGFGLNETTFLAAPWCDLHCRGSTLGMIFILIFLLGIFFWFIIDCYIIHAPRFRRVVLNDDITDAEGRLQRRVAPKTWFQQWFPWLPGVPKPVVVKRNNPLVADPAIYGTPIEMVLMRRYGGNGSQESDKKEENAASPPREIKLMGPIPTRESTTTASRLPSSQYGYYPRHSGI